MAKYPILLTHSLVQNWTTLRFTTMFLNLAIKDDIALCNAYRLVFLTDHQPDSLTDKISNIIGDIIPDSHIRSKLSEFSQVEKYLLLVKAYLHGNFIINF